MPTFGQGIELSVAVVARAENGNRAETVVTFEPGEGFILGPEREDSQRVTKLHVFGTLEAKALADALRWASDAIRLKFLAQGMELP